MASWRRWFIYTSEMETKMVPRYIIKYIYLFPKGFLKTIFIYLALLGLSCSMWDLQSSLKHAAFGIFICGR